jgi:FixJ family two-component response regulator
MTHAADVFIVDDDAAVRKSLDRLARSAGYRTHLFGSAGEFLGHARGDAPGCLLLDVQLPDLSGLSLQQTLAERATMLPIIFITGHGDIPMSVRAIKAGAVDFLTKPCEDTSLLAALAQAIALDTQARRQQEQTAELQRRVASLTRREREVCAHVAAGRLNKQIAGDLGTCEQTIKVHRMRIMEKLQLRSLADLVRVAEKTGIALPPPES